MLDVQMLMCLEMIRVLSLFLYYAYTFRIPATIKITGILNVGFRLVIC